MTPVPYNENIALLTGGPSLAYTWHDGMYSLFRSVHVVNMVGKRYFHDYVHYLDTPHRIFGDKGVYQWPKTMKGYMDRKPQPFDPECSITFPAAFDFLMRTTRDNARIFIFGWDCEGDGVVDKQTWKKCRNSHERYLMKKYWQPEKVAGVSGKMHDWAKEELGFQATPINEFSKIEPPPKHRN